MNLHSSTSEEREDIITDSSLYYALLKGFCSLTQSNIYEIHKIFCELKASIINHSIQDQRNCLIIEFIRSNILCSTQNLFHDLINIIIFCEKFYIKLEYNDDFVKSFMYGYQGTDMALSEEFLFYIKYVDNCFILEAKVASERLADGNLYAENDTATRRQVLNKMERLIITKGYGQVFSTRPIERIADISKYYVLSRKIYDPEFEIADLRKHREINNNLLDLDGFYGAFKMDNFFNVLNTTFEFKFALGSIINKKFLVRIVNKHYSIKDLGYYVFGKITAFSSQLNVYLVSAQYKNENVLKEKIYLLHQSLKEFLIAKYKSNPAVLFYLNLNTLQTSESLYGVLSDFFYRNDILDIDKNFFYVEKFGLKSLTFNLSPAKLVKKMQNIFSIEGLKKLYIDICVSKYDESEIAPFQKYITIRKEILEKVIVKNKVFVHLMNKYLSASNICTTKRVKEKIKCNGYIKKYNFYNPYLYILNDKILKFYDYPINSFAEIEQYYEISGSSRLISSIENLKLRLEIDVHTHSAFRSEITVQFDNIFSGFAFLCTINNKNENFNSIDQNLIKQTLHNYCTYLIDNINSSLINSLQNIHFKLITESLLINVILKGNFKNNNFLDRDQLKYLETSINESKFEFRPLSNILDNICNKDNKAKLQDIKRLIDYVKRRNMNSKRDYEKFCNNLDSIFQILELSCLSVFEFCSSLIRMNDEIVKEYTKEFKKENDIFPTEVQEDLCISTFIEKIYFSKSIFYNKLYKACEFYINTINNSNKGWKWLGENLQQAYIRKDIKHGIMIITKKEYKKFNILFYIDDEKIEEPLKEIEFLKNFIKSNIKETVKLSNGRESNWEFEESARLFISYVTYKNLNRTSTLDRICEMIRNDVRSGLMERKSVDQLKNRISAIKNPKKTKGVIYGKIKKFIEDFDLSYQVEEREIFNIYNGFVNNSKNNEFLKNLFYVFYYYKYLGYYLTIKNEIVSFKTLQETANVKKSNSVKIFREMVLELESFYKKGDLYDSYVRKNKTVKNNEVNQIREYENMTSFNYDNSLKDDNMCFVSKEANLACGSETTSVNNTIRETDQKDTIKSTRIKTDGVFGNGNVKNIKIRESSNKNRNLRKADRNKEGSNVTIKDENEITNKFEKTKSLLLEFANKRDYGVFFTLNGFRRGFIKNNRPELSICIEAANSLVENEIFVSKKIGRNFMFGRAQKDK